MEKITVDSADVPTALPGFEEDDAREKLLLENSSDETEAASDEEIDDADEPTAKPHKRSWQVLRTFAAFAVFVCILVGAIAWFFGMGWFSKPQTQAVNRTSNQKDAPTTGPATEDEKLKMALSMVATPSSAPVSDAQPAVSSVPVDINRTEVLNGTVDVDGVPPETFADRKTRASIGATESYSLPLGGESPISGEKPNPSGPTKSVTPENGTRSIPVSKDTDSIEARGRSLFFGISKDAPAKDERIKATEPDTPKPVSPNITSLAEIPFGTMLPVRLVGTIYTLRNSGGFVRMELTRAIEGKGYAYPAGTMIVGNVRSGESVRAFVNIVGLIDPVSGELLRFSGELLGTDGSSGIEGKRRNLNSRWARFFRGMKETASSVLGSVGALRSGGTVVLSEPMRRGSESMSEDLSGALLTNERESTFLEVAAGSNGYVLVTGLPGNATSLASKLTREAAKQ
ncbi:MAG: hypothetical protein UZ17_ACD001002875 [Acidobacteria bacterium OLB17]|nr:MAG: hypothetical protein UZ17_ACD001002875 [Acidobacteria bacterium OLB17]MCZ2391575.1 hypothetical protein [Acidobacteriota bacterium]